MSAAKLHEFGTNALIEELWQRGDLPLALKEFELRQTWRVGTARYFPKVRERRIWRQRLLTPICWLAGHRWGLIRPIVPNPYATESWVEGCGRCSAVRRA